jgi:hypothetical protein
MAGWIKLRRSLIDWEWYDDHNATRLLIHLLLTVNYEEKKWKGLTIKAGQMVLSWDSLSIACMMTKQQCRTAMVKLEKSKEVTRQATNRFQLITLVKWDKIQIVDSSYNTSHNTQTTDKQHSDNIQITPTKESKEYKELSYSESDFLLDWNKCRTHYLNKPSYIDKLKTMEKVDFNKSLNIFTGSDIKKALHGLFKQEVINFDSMVLRPKHFLERVQDYLDAENSKSYAMYGKKQVQH